MNSILREYRQKRSFKKTPEPGVAPGQTNTGQYLVFVVHKHASRRLHYDLRLEMGGVLKSFAVPKGPSLDPSVRRLAVEVEDHPFDYKDFEGVIPKGNYGAGSVIIWDRGLYGSPFSKDKHDGERLLLEGLKKGDLKLVLAGNKLKGEFALVKTRWDAKSWLLLKHKDKYTTTTDILRQDRSVVSGKTIEELPAKSRGGSVSASAVRKSPDELMGNAPMKPLQNPLLPMQPTVIKKPFNHADWIFEIKWDGYRAIAELDGKKVSLYSRNHIPLMKKFAPVVASLQKLGLTAVLDGEIIVAGKNGIPDFEKLQHYAGSAGGRLEYHVFDILSYRGRNLTGVPLILRKELLQTVLAGDKHVQFSKHIWKEGVSFFDAAKQKGIEGIVAKHSQSLYKPGARSDQWLKIKSHSSQDCVIAGFTAPRGSRKYLGSLVLGAYDKGNLVYIGHSGGGFSAHNLKTMYETLRPLTRRTCPFKTLPAEEAATTWIKPLLVCEVAFTGWTRDAMMRHPRFMRMRDDKEPHEAIIAGDS
jgi:bifunctional non-homologous end joining protein LigD